MPARSRRRFLATLGAVGAAVGSSAAGLAAGGPVEPRYPVGVCDWMILKRQKLGAFKLAAEIGADGVEVDMGGLGDRPTFDNKLADAAVREQARGGRDGRKYLETRASFYRDFLKTHGR